MCMCVCMCMCICMCRVCACAITIIGLIYTIIELIRASLRHCGVDRFVLAGPADELPDQAVMHVNHVACTEIEVSEG